MRRVKARQICKRHGKLGLHPSDIHLWGTTYLEGLLLEVHPRPCNDGTQCLADPVEKIDHPYSGKALTISPRDGLAKFAKIFF
jgi:hypothetical protein